MKEYYRLGIFALEVSVDLIRQERIERIQIGIRWNPTFLQRILPKPHVQYLLAGVIVQFRSLITTGFIAAVGFLSGF